MISYSRLSLRDTKKTIRAQRLENQMTTLNLLTPSGTFDADDLAKGEGERVDEFSKKLFQEHLRSKPVIDRQFQRINLSVQIPFF